MQNQKLKISTRARSIIIGVLLGDGHLEQSPSGKTFRLKVEHSIKQKSYVSWLYRELKSLIPGEIYTRIRNDRKYIGFRTSYLGSLRFYGQQFYVDKKKIIPKLIHKMLNPIALAIWYLDDGSVKSSKHNTYIIHSLGFSLIDLEKVVLVLEQKLNIQARLHKQKDKYYRIYILSQSAQRFTDLVKPIVSEVGGMDYKLVTKMPKK